MTITTTPTATQTAHPWRATLRTILAALVGLAAAWALIIETLGLDAGIPWVATSLAIAGAVTRVLALPAVTDWLERYLPWLAPAPASAVVTRQVRSTGASSRPPCRMR